MPDGSFTITDTYSEPGYREFSEFSGKLIAPGSASGTFKLSLELDDVPGVGTLHCQTGAQPVSCKIGAQLVSWNAS